MQCPVCNHELGHLIQQCPECGFDFDKITWVLLTDLYPPMDLVAESLFKSYGIPYKILRKEIPQFPISIGPLAEVKIYVPDILVDRAQKLLASLPELNPEI